MPHQRGRAGPAFSKTSLRRYESWIRNEERHGEEIAADIAARDFPPVTVEVLLEMHADALTVGVARRLTARAHALITSNPKKSTTLALLASRVADAATAPPEFLHGLDTTRGEAWMRYAAAVFELGNFPKAWEAAERAETYFDLASPFPPAARSATTLGLIQGKILHFLGRTDEGLLRIEQSANLLLNVYEERARYVEAMTIYNAILMRADRFDEAAQRWEEIAGLAREQGDDATLAHVVNNVGRCYLQLGRTDEAKNCFSAALELFTQCRLDTDIPEARLNLAYALRQEGRFRESVTKLRRARDELARLGIMFSAAEVTLRIVETELLANPHQDLLQTCEQAVAFFREAGLPEQAQKAGDYLVEAARARRLSPKIVEDVCTFLTRLRDSPEQIFRSAM